MTKVEALEKIDLKDFLDLAYKKLDWFADPKNPDGFVKYWAIWVIKYSAFKKWRYRKKYGLEDDTKTASMLPIEVTSKPSKKLSEITLTLPSEAKLFLSSISAKELKSVLSELGLLS